MLLLSISNTEYGVYQNDESIEISVDDASVVD